MIQISINRFNWLPIKLVVTPKEEAILHTIKLQFNREVEHNNLVKHSLLKLSLTKLRLSISQEDMQELINNNKIL